MFRQLIKILLRSPVNDLEQAPYQTEHMANINWQPLDVSRLNLTSQRLRQIEASLAEKTRAEFAAVTQELMTAQLAKTGQDE